MPSSALEWSQVLLHLDGRVSFSHRKVVLLKFISFFPLCVERELCDGGPMKLNKNYILFPWAG